MSFWTLFTIVEVVWVAILAVGLILERRSPVATLAWLLVLMWLPAFGFVVYLLLGPRRLHRTKLRRAATKSQVQASMDLLEEQEEPIRAQLAQLAVSAGEAPPMRAAKLSLFTEGDECYEAILRAIEGAQHHVHLEYYIWQPDGIGTRLRDALVAKARQKIEVRLLLDFVGA